MKSKSLRLNINGLPTPLCGCDSECDKGCIRKDPRFKYRGNLRVNGECGCYIACGKFEEVNKL